MKCNKCGTENPKNKSVCSKCGNFLYSHTPNNRVLLTREQKQKRRKAMFKSSSLGCLWSSLIIIGMMILLAVITYLAVRFLIPADMLPTSVTTST